MATRRVYDKDRLSKSRVAFDLGPCISTCSEQSSPSNAPSISRGDLPKNVQQSSWTKDEDVNRSSTSSVGYSDESDSIADNGYIIIGNQKRRMSNALNALDLDIIQKRRQRASLGGCGPCVPCFSPPFPSVGNFNYFYHSPMMTEPTPPTMAATDVSTADTVWPLTSTDQFMGKHSYKVQLAQGIQKMDQAFPFINASSTSTRWRESILHGLAQLNEAIEEAWSKPLIGSDLAVGMSDHLRSTANLEAICRLFVEDKYDLWKEAGKTIENYFSDRNRNYIILQPWFKDFLSALLMDDKPVDRRSTEEQPVDRERYRLSASLLESLIRHGPEICRRIADVGGLDFLLRVCRREWSNGGKMRLTADDNWETLRDAASALCNLAVLGGREVRKCMVEKNIPSWMFVLLSHKDIRISYYACLIVGVIANECECEQAVEQSQTLPLVVTFMNTHQPEDVAPLDVKYRSGRTKPWLQAITGMLRSSRNEVQALACFQLAKEACIRRNKENGIQTAVELFEEIGALSIVKEIASSPYNPLATNFAEQVLQIVGEIVPRKLSQSVPLWTVADVEFWVTQIGFGDYSAQFARYRVDGDLLLRTTDRHLINEIRMHSEYERMRFTRELNSLKRSADYSCVDPTRMDLWLMGLDRDLSIYTYDMLLNGIDRRGLIHVDDTILRNEGSISNTLHRTKILHAIRESEFEFCFGAKRTHILIKYVRVAEMPIFSAKTTNRFFSNTLRCDLRGFCIEGFIYKPEVKHVDELDIALLRKQVDIFICYRRSTGSQLASLLKVHLQLRGYKVFIDVDRLYAGQFDASLLKNIRAAKHFLLVLTPHALDRCLDDHSCKDWVHLEIRTALEFGRNIVPVQDKGFVWPELSSLPTDIRPIAFFNAVQWVHEYQEACVEKLDKFLKGDLKEAGGTHETQAHLALTNGVDEPMAGTSVLNLQPKRLSQPMNVYCPAPLVNKQLSECTGANLRSCLKRSATVAARLDSV